MNSTPSTEDYHTLFPLLVQAVGVAKATRWIKEAQPQLEALQKRIEVVLGYDLLPETPPAVIYRPPREECPQVTEFP